MSVIKNIELTEGGPRLSVDTCGILAADVLDVLDRVGVTWTVDSQGEAGQDRFAYVQTRDGLRFVLTHYLRTDGGEHHVYDDIEVKGEPLGFGSVTYQFNRFCAYLGLNDDDIVMPFLSWTMPMEYYELLQSVKSNTSTDAVVQDLPFVEDGSYRLPVLEYSGMLKNNVVDVFDKHGIVFHKPAVDHGEPGPVEYATVLVDGQRYYQITQHLSSPQKGYEISGSPLYGQSSAVLYRFLLDMGLSWRDITDTEREWPFPVEDVEREEARRDQLGVPFLGV